MPQSARSRHHCPCSAAVLPLQCWCSPTPQSRRPLQPTSATCTVHRRYPILYSNNHRSSWLVDQKNCPHLFGPPGLTRCRRQPLVPCGCAARLCRCQAAIARTIVPIQSSHTYRWLPSVLPSFVYVITTMLLIVPPDTPPLLVGVELNPGPYTAILPCYQSKPPDGLGQGAHDAYDLLRARVAHHGASAAALRSAPSSARARRATGTRCVRPPRTLCRSHHWRCFRDPGGIIHRYIRPAEPPQQRGEDLTLARLRVVGRHWRREKEDAVECAGESSTREADRHGTLELALHTAALHALCSCSAIEDCAVM